MNPPTGRRLHEPCQPAETATTPEPGGEEDPNDSGIESNSGTSNCILERGESASSDVFEPDNLHFSKLQNKTEHLKSSHRPLVGRLSLLLLFLNWDQIDSKNFSLEFLDLSVIINQYRHNQ